MSHPKTPVLSKGLPPLSLSCLWFPFPSSSQLTAPFPRCLDAGFVTEIMLPARVLLLQKTQPGSLLHLGISGTRIALTQYALVHLYCC